LQLAPFENGVTSNTRGPCNSAFENSDRLIVLTDAGLLFLPESFFFFCEEAILQAFRLSEDRHIAFLLCIDFLAQLFGSLGSLSLAAPSAPLVALCIVVALLFLQFIFLLIKALTVGVSPVVFPAKKRIVIVLLLKYMVAQMQNLITS